MELREIRETEYTEALDLAWEVFLAYEAPDYDEQGVQEFYRSIHDPQYVGQLQCYGAFLDGQLAGMIATRNGGEHIALFFVKSDHQRKGIGRRLFELAAGDNASGTMTVNASPYAVEIYRRLGFRSVGEECTVSGLRFTPMECDVDQMFDHAFFRQMSQKYVYRLEKPEKAAVLFEGWNETLIWSCLQGVMGEIYVDSEVNPASAVAVIGDFCFLAGEPDEGILSCFVENGMFSDRFFVMVPRDESWAAMVRERLGERARQVERYAFLKEPNVFDREKLETVVSKLPKEYHLRLIDGELFERCLDTRWSRDLVSVFPGYEFYEKHGLGVLLMQGEEILSGASSYTAYNGGIEIEIDTREDCRRRGFAYICGAKLILECLKRGLYPSWDAQNKWSVALAEKLGYHFDHAYQAFEVGPL